MTWQREVDEIKHRRRLSEQGGDPERIARQHMQGKLTIRERIVALTDPESFHEIGGLSGIDTYDGDKLVAVMPMGLVIGWCTLNGRSVLINGNDSTVRVDIPSGRSAVGFSRVVCLAEITALQWRSPYVRLLDGPGASVRHYETTGRPEFVSLNQWIEASSRLLATVPVVSVIMGAAAGIYGIEACLCHFNVIVKNTGQVFPGGPPVVKVALGYEVTKEELGGWQMATSSGVIDNFANNEEEAFVLVRRFLSYMPDNVWQIPPRIEPTDDPNRRDEELLSVIPKWRDKPYDPREILNHVCDHGSVFEIAPFYGQSSITVLARLNGYPVGVIINDPASPTAGAIDVDTIQKVIRFLRLCNTFHLPIVYFVDDSEYKSGIDSEKQGIVRAAARIVQEIYHTKVPWISIIIGRVQYNAGSMALRPGSLSRRYAWPSVTWGIADAELRAMPAHRIAGIFGIEDVIDPRDTRPLLCRLVEIAQKAVEAQLGSSSGPAYRP